MKMNFHMYNLTEMFQTLNEIRDSISEVSFQLSAQSFNLWVTLLNPELGLICHQESGAVLGRSHKHGVHQAAAAELSAQHLQQAVT